MRSFRAAVEAGDLAAVEELLADDVVFTSPVAFRPYRGRAVTAAVLRGVSRVFTDFRYVREVTGADGRDQVLVFTAKVGDKEINGSDFLHLDEDGRIDDLMVMVRPLSAARALAEAMGAEFGRISREAAEADAAATDA
ncbi:nuclear transport factor 2 family protein [Streptomyces sp. NPDC008313]|uniref:nuclear transport factor 2 family protein n=1 Tax=Streptomyces sp. NPDC008313 TaxID=3364826 RepID=UPI0036EF327A